MTPTIRKLELQLRAVANARRLGILAFIKKKQSATVTEIAEAARLQIPSASQHLRILKNADIVRHVKRKQFVTYRLSLKQSEPIKKVIAMLQ